MCAFVPAGTLCACWFKEIPFTNHPTLHVTFFPFLNYLLFGILLSCIASFFQWEVLGCSPTSWFNRNASSQFLFGNWIFLIIPFWSEQEVSLGSSDGYFAWEKKLVEKLSVSVYCLLYTEKQLLHSFYKCEKACACNCKYFSTSTLFKSVFFKLVLCLTLPGLIWTSLLVFKP